MLNHFTFNGHSTAEYGLLVTALNPYSAPSRRVEKIQIPYRNGDLVIDSGTYNNIIVSYEIALTNSTQTNADAIRNWLLDSQGYHQLTDTINTDSFRIACYYDDIQYTLTALYKYGKAVISFDCFPQRYLTSNTTITRNATSTTTTAEGGTFSSHVYPLPIELKGNTTQEGTPTPTSPQTVHNVSGDNDIIVMGKNRFKPRELTAYTQYGMTVSYDPASQIYTFNGTCNHDNTSFALGDIPVNVTRNSTRLYVFWAGGSVTTYANMRMPDDTWTYGLNCGIVTLSASNPVLNSGTNAHSFVSNRNNQSIRFNNGSVATNFKIKLMVLDGTTDVYEEYKGITYHFPLPVENVLPNPITESTVNGITVTKADDGTLTFNGTASSTTYFDFSTSFNTSQYVGYKFYGFPSNAQGCGIRISASDSDRTGVQNDIGSNGGAITDSNSGRCIAFRVPSGTVLDNYVLKPMLTSPINTKVTYTPYGTSPIELNKIGSYQDYLYKNGNKWYLHKETKKLTFNGTETINYNSGISSMWMTISDNIISNAEVLTVSSHFKGVSFNNRATESVPENYFENHYLQFRNVSYTVPSDFRDFLVNNNVVVYYVLETSTNTEITDATLLSQLNAIDSAMAFETSTTIAQVNNDAPFSLTYTNIGSATVTSNYRGEPIITVNDTGYIYINGASIKVNQVPMTINSQTMQAYNGNINLNNYIELNEFPMLKKGNNDIGSTMALSIVPNYWKL